MPIEFEAEGLKHINNRLDAMLAKLDHFSKVELGDVMSDWQTKDVHRHRPFTMRWRGQKRQVATKFRPHSLYEVKRSLLQERWARRHRMPPRRWSTRPFLRPGMWDKLVQEMTDAFHAAIKW